MARLTQRQRQALKILGFANLIALIALGVLLVQAPPLADNALMTSPIDAEHLDVCRQAISRALFEVDESGMVQTGENGMIRVHLQRAEIAGDPRQVADAAVWTALEAIAGRNDCLAFSGIQITVAFTRAPSTASPRPNDRDASQWTGQRLRATAHVRMADLLRWSLGELDDAELALRLDYYPPATPEPGSIEATASP